MATQSHSYTLVIHCRPGTAFRGTYMAVGINGTASSHSASGLCPDNGIQTFTESGVSILSASIQKQEENGLLVLEIAETGGAVLVRSETRDPFGVVLAAVP